MLEMRNYTKLELAEMLGTSSNQGIKRKLDRYGVIYTSEGRGENIQITIKDIPDKLKVFCIIELKASPQTDFKKLRNFLYYFLCDESFVELPDESKEALMREEGFDISRQTIANYIERLERNNLLSKKSGNYVYYFSSKEEVRRVEKEVYCEAWKEYWEIKKGCDYWGAITYIYEKYGGYPHKYEIPEFNGIFNSERNYIMDLVCESIENELQ